jgi:hypothetical protein
VRAGEFLLARGRADRALELGTRTMLTDLGVDPEPATAMLERRLNPASTAG